MKTAAWFQRLLDKNQPKVKEKNLKKALDKKARELTASQQSNKGPLTRASMSSWSRPFFSLESQTDSSGLLARALALTAVIGCLHKDTVETRVEIVRELLGSSPEWDKLEKKALEVLDLAVGYNCEDLSDYSKRPLGLVKSETFEKNFSPWTLKMRDSVANAPDGYCLPHRPGAKESEIPPPVGVATSCYGYYERQHVRNNRGIDANHFLNLKVEIDGKAYSLQSLLSLQVFPDWCRQAINKLPQMKELSSVLAARAQSQPGFYKYAHVGPDRGIRLLVDDIPREEPEEIEITPVTSVQFLEDFQASYFSLNSDYSDYRLKSRGPLLEMTVGDGNPVNVGAFSSNRNGQIAHIGQSDYLRLPRRLKSRINRLFHYRVLTRSEAARYYRPKHPQESSYNFKQRKMRGYERAAARYLNFCQRLHDEIDAMIKKGEYADRQEFLSFFNRNQNKRSMLELLLEGFGTGEFVDMISRYVYGNLSRNPDIPLEEREGDVRTISSVLWRIIK